LFELLTDASSEQFLMLFDSFAANRSEAIPLVQESLAGMPTNRQLVGEMRTAEAKRYANVGLLAVKLGLGEQVWPKLRDSIDNSIRSEILLALTSREIPPELLIDALISAQHEDERRVLLTGIGNLSQTLSPSQIQTVSDIALDWYENDRDAGIHGVCRWLLLTRFKSIDPENGTEGRNFQALVNQIDSKLATGKQEAGRDWYINGQGQAMTVIDGPVEFLMGSTNETARDRDTDELRRKRRIDRSFAISQLEVTTEQFRRFWNERPNLRKFYDYPDDFYGESNSELTAGRMNWFMAAEYCNWLSEQEGIPEDQWCFPKKVDRVNGIVIPSDYFERTGYRLLSEAEWELACRDGSLTTWHFGSNPNLFDAFSWWYANADDRIRPPGLRLPIGNGLFDLYGNAMEWVVDGQPMDLKLVDDVMNRPDVTDKISRILRGGAFFSMGRYARSAYRDGYTPDAAEIGMGIRLGRTMPNGKLP